MKVNDKYLTAAYKVLGANAGGLLAGGRIPSVYNGYVSAFGGSMVQPGFYPAVLSYYSDEKKGKIAELIYKIYQEAEFPATRVFPSFLDFAEANSNSRQVRNNIAQSVIALKLVLRTFSFENENEQL